MATGAINHKKTGKGIGWLCWSLLIATSIPVHFLANSVIGPSFYIHPPSNVTYTTMDQPYNISASIYYSDFAGVSQINNQRTSSGDSACWTAFRANQYVLPVDFSYFAEIYETNILGNSTTFESVEVRYTTNCTQYKNNVDVSTALGEVIPLYDEGFLYGYVYNKTDCALGTDVLWLVSSICPRTCRSQKSFPHLDFEMQFLSILLSIKRFYCLLSAERAWRRSKIWRDLPENSVKNPNRRGNLFSCTGDLYCFAKLY